MSVSPSVYLSVGSEVVVTSSDSSEFQLHPLRRSMQLLGRFLSITGQNPSVSNSKRLHDLPVFLRFVRYIPFIPLK